MIAELASGIAAVKTMGELVALVHKMKVDDAVTAKVMELNATLLSLQNDDLALYSKYRDVLSEKDTLKAKLVEMENWEIEAAKYELSEISAGVVAYALKPDEGSTAPPHWLCANCFNQKQKSIIQKTIQAGGALGDIYLCARCQATAFVKPKR